MRPPQPTEAEDIELRTPAAGRGDAGQDEAAAARADATSTTSQGRQEEGDAVDLSVSSETTPTSSVRTLYRVGEGAEDEETDTLPEDREGDDSEQEEDYEDQAADDDNVLTAGAATEGVSSSPDSPDRIPLFIPGSPQHISAAEGVDTAWEDRSSCSNSDDEGGGFEFPFVSSYQQSVDDDDDQEEILVRRVYPVFDRELFRFYVDEASRAQQLRDAATVFGAGVQKEPKRKSGPRTPLGRLMMLEEREREPSTSSSEADELEGLSPDSYCVWTPGGGPAPQTPRRRKSNSTGGSGGAGGVRRWRLKDLVIGRSHSDGKKKFLYLVTEEEGVRNRERGNHGEKKGKKKQEAAVAAADKKKKKKTAAVTSKKKGAKVSAPMDVEVLAAHRRLNHTIPSPPGPSPPTLPPLPTASKRKMDILGGLFANVNGSTRNFLHPF